MSTSLKRIRNVRLRNDYSNKACSDKNSLLLKKKKKRTSDKLSYEDVLKLLSVSAEAEKERVDSLFQSKMSVSEEHIHIEGSMTGIQTDTEDSMTGIQRVLSALVPSLYMNKYYSFAGMLHYPIPVEWFCEIEQPLTTSKTFDSLCFKLQAPYHLVTGFCGRQALLNLCTFTKQGTSVYSGHQDKQGIDEVFDVVTQQVHLLTKEELMKLLYFNFSLKDFSRKCYNRVYSEFMRKLTSNKYGINELLDFLNLLKQVDKSLFTDIEATKFETLIQRIWNHLSCEPGLFSPSDLVELYSYAPDDQNKIFPVLNKILRKNIDHMNVCDVFMILKEIYAREDSQKVVDILNEWLENNLNKLTANDIETILTRFIRSRFVSRLLLKNLPALVVSDRVMKDLSTRLMDLILHYCVLGRHFDRTILETACNQYIEDTLGYTSEQLSNLIKAIGTFSFVHYRQQAFFSKVELHLMENFYNIDVLTLLEMFVHLIYIDKVAVNFEKYIFAPLFLGIVHEMPDEERRRGVKYLRIIELAFTARNFKPDLTLPVDPERERITCDEVSHQIIQPVFAKLLRDESKVRVKPTPTWSAKYLEVQYRVLAQRAGRYESFRGNDRFAFLVVTENSFSMNDRNHMLGHEMANIRLLQEQGLNVYTAHIDRLKELKEKNKLEGFVDSLFIHVLDAAEQSSKGFDGEEGTADVASGNEKEVFVEEEEDFEKS